MSRKLAEIDDALSNIHKAVRAAKTLHEKNGELARIIEATTKQADSVEEIQIPDEPLLVQLKQATRKLRGSGPKLEAVLKFFITETGSFEKFLRTKVLDGTIPPELMGEFCDNLEKMHGFAKSFYEVFNEFFDHLSETLKTATRLTDKLKQKVQEKRKQANIADAVGVAQATGLALAGAGLVALGFFTGGAAWVAAGVAAGAFCGAGAAAVNALTAEKVAEMRKMADDILANANGMGDIAKSLKACSDRADVIKLDKQAIEELKTALAVFEKKVEDEKDRKIAELEAQRSQVEDERNKKIAELEAKLRSLGH